MKTIQFPLFPRAFNLSHPFICLNRYPRHVLLLMHITLVKSVHSDDHCGRKNPSCVAWLTVSCRRLLQGEKRISGNVPNSVYCIRKKEKVNPFPSTRRGNDLGFVCITVEWLGRIKTVLGWIHTRLVVTQNDLHPICRAGPGRITASTVKLYCLETYVLLAYCWTIIALPGCIRVSTSFANSTLWTIWAVTPKLKKIAWS